MSCNIFAYCFNSPIMYSDADGYWGKNDHVALCNSYGRSTFINNIAFFDKECDVTFASKNGISYPFHNRDRSMLKKSVQTLYNYALSIYKNRQRRKFNYSDIFSKNGFTCKYNGSVNAQKAINMNYRILDYINSSNIDYKAQSAMLLGFCLHMLQDFYAHQIFVLCSDVSTDKMTITELDQKLHKKYRYFTRCSLEDNKDIFSWRYSETKNITKKLLDIFFSGKKVTSINFSDSYDHTYTRILKVKIKSLKYEYLFIFTHHQKVSIST